MRRATRLFVALLVAFLFIGSRSLAQNNEQPLLVVSFNMVSMSDVGKLNKMVDSLFASIL